MEKLNDRHLQFEPLQLSDANDVFDLWSDKEAVQRTNWPYLTTAEECVLRLKKVLQFYANPLHFGPFSIRLHDGAFVGIIGGDLSENPCTFEIWYFLKRDKRGRGLGKAALAQLLKKMRESGRVESVMAAAITDNMASWKLLECFGFQRARMVPAAHTKHGQKLDLYEYRLEI